METFFLIVEGHLKAYHYHFLLTRISHMVTLESLYDFGRLPLTLGGNYGRVMWAGQRGLHKWLNFRTWGYFRLLVLQRGNFQCTKCRKKLRVPTEYPDLYEYLPFVCDHIIPLFKGGKDWYEDPEMINFQTLCEDCNREKTKLDKCVPKTSKERAELISRGLKPNLNHQLNEFDTYLA